MRTNRITILGQERPLCYSTRVYCGILDKYGDLEKLGNEMLTGDLQTRIHATMWTLAAMLKAGKAYADLCGESAPDPLTEEQLLEVFGVDDLVRLCETVVDTITEGSKREAEAEPPKN